MSEHSAGYDRLADAWDHGYDAALLVAEAGLFRILAQGEKGLAGIGRAANPYRVTAPDTSASGEKA